MPVSSRADSASAADPRRAIHPDQLRALIQMQRYPTAYVQRVVEHLAFLPGGGQQWRRDVQMRLPTDPRQRLDGEDFPGVPTMRPDHKQLFVVSLGMFTPARFADFCVKAGDGSRINLLTRVQHGFCLTSAFLFKYFSEEQLSKASSKDDFDAFWRAANAMFTTVGGSLGEEPPAAESVAALLVSILDELGAPAEELEQKRTRLLAEYKSLRSVTQYLCWVFAEPGETISLSATYTMRDAPRIRLSLPGSPPAAGDRFAELRRKLRRHRLGFAIRRTDFYAATGLGPLNYQLRTPAHDHAGSYYFLVAPPQNCKVSFLDWGLDNSIDRQGSEVDCAFDSVHVHNGAKMVGPGGAHTPTRSSMPGSTISAFLRADFKDFWPLLITALLTILLAFLAQRGQFVGEEAGISSVLLIAPTALLAYIAQRQSHHYAQATRWLGPLLVVYLLANVVFIASVQYDVLGGDTIFDRANALDDLISGSIGVASAGLFCWLLAINFRDRIIRKRFAKVTEPANAVDRYSKLGIRYADRVFALLMVAFVGLIVTAIFTGGCGWGAGRVHAMEVQKSRQQESDQPKNHPYVTIQAPAGGPTTKPAGPDSR
jgi:hypothetical protein